MAKQPDDDPLADMKKFFSRPNIWSFPDAASDPVKYIEAWAVFRATPADSENTEHYGLHFMGRNLADWCGAVSSKIVSFDPETMRGVTRSGRVYQLIGLPGYCDDAHYVKHAWGERNKVTIMDATEEFFKQYGLSMEVLEKKVYAQNAASSRQSGRARKPRKAKAPTTASSPRTPRKPDNARKPRKPRK